MSELGPEPSLCWELFPPCSMATRDIQALCPTVPTQTFDHFWAMLDECQSVTEFAGNIELQGLGTLGVVRSGVK